MNDSDVTSQVIKQLHSAQKRQQSEWIIKLCRLSQVIYGSNEVPQKLKILQDEHETAMTLLDRVAQKIEPPPRPPPPPMKPPRFVKLLEDVTIDEDPTEYLHLTCQVQSDSQFPELIWTLNDHKITDNTDFDEGTGICTLKVKKTSSCSGTYACKAVTFGGEDVTTSEVTIRKPVLSKPAFYVPLKNQECFEGESMVLEAVVQQENVDVIWYENQEEIVENSAKMIRRNGDVHQLLLHQVTNSAEFKMKASNPAGESTSSCFLTVKPRKVPKPKKVCSFTEHFRMMARNLSPLFFFYRVKRRRS